MIKRIICLFILTIFAFASGQSTTASSKFTLARLKYSGGGDWYNDPSCIPNLLTFLKIHTTIDAGDDEARVSIMDEELFSYPVLFMTGHGRISFSSEEAERLRLYLESGGFLYADDDYGMDEYFRKEMEKVFPNKKLLAVPFSHPVYQSHFAFSNGLPKIHEHDGGPPAGFAYFHNGRMVVFYSFNTNISDGWADPDVHGDPPHVREQALQMGANIVIYALSQ